eukprot:gb/GEZN01008774.1/.p1 GENE.gb/GEZN01008774.1/~~gb/GEZN01008774.1/.p1  ORF type:complete len:265 (-),score=11.12 gb/GEZN01008774.1/:339-1133(-)
MMEDRSTFPSEFTVLCCMVFASFCLHYTIFALSKTSHHKPQGGRSRIASNAHCFGSISAVVVFLLWRGGVDVWDGPLMILGHGFNPAEMLYIRLVVCFSVGFFMSDLLIMATSPSVYALDSVIHHLLIMPFFCFGIYMNTCTPCHFLYLLEEISTLFLNWRWFLLPPKGTKLSSEDNVRLIFVSQCFALSFLFVRCIVGQAFWFTYLPNHNSVSVIGDAQHGGWSSYLQEMFSYAQFTVCTLTRILNLYWLRIIYIGAIKAKVI